MIMNSLKITKCVVMVLISVLLLYLCVGYFMGRKAGHDAVDGIEWFISRLNHEAEKVKK